MISFFFRYFYTGERAWVKEKDDTVILRPVHRDGFGKYCHAYFSQVRLFADGTTSARDDFKEWTPFVNKT